MGRLAFGPRRLGQFPKRNVLYIYPRSRTMSSSTRSNRTVVPCARSPTIISRSCVRTLEYPRQRLGPDPRDPYRNVAFSSRFLFAVTHPKLPLAVSHPVFPSHPTTTSHTGKSPAASSVQSTCLVAIRADAWVSREASAHLSGRRKPEAHTSKTDTLPAYVHDPVFPHCQRRVVPDMGPFWQRCVIFPLRDDVL